ncbi:MAG: tRNA lysidine(34) synthetase TilS [Alphaproteobacteria bacterium]|jgi:tRNA(Ile)-lysidine synthase|nr:tRNA lysidine(34) synthetase TilS [Alphaproteobacteria bacterium]
MPAIGKDQFAALMRPLGPFEKAPDLAVAVSGGADSMALALLAHAWARQRGGAITALTVDHGLRRAAAGEARQVRAWLQGHGIAHQTLRWRGAKPDSGIQAAARQARYDLLGQWCRRRGVLHLLTAHHGDDQAETLLLRIQQGSGIEGLAGMPMVRALPGVRLLRPLLQRRGIDLAASLNRRGQPWLEDPSNQEERYARVRARRHLADTNSGAGGTAGLLRLAGEAATVRRQLRGALADLAARTVRLHPAGFCRFDPAPCLGQNQALLAPLLADILRCIGGGIHRPRRDRVARLCQDLIQHKLVAGRTLAGSRVLPHSDGLLFCREAGRLPGWLEVGAEKSGRWDRFEWNLAGKAAARLSVGALGQDGWRQVRGQVRGWARASLPAPVRPGLPALWHGDQVLAVPHLNLTAVDLGPKGPQSICFTACFSPFRPLQPDAMILV